MTKPETTHITISFYSERDLRARARAAFRATADREDERTWSEMLCKALEIEIERRESVYNNGRSYDRDECPLPVGRPSNSR